MQVKKTDSKRKKDVTDRNFLIALIFQNITQQLKKINLVSG